MSVIAHLRIPAESFELGRILDLEPGVSVELENMVPLGETAVPFISVHDSSNGIFETKVRNHPSVSGLRTVSEHDDRILYALDWEVSRDLFFQGMLETDAQLLSATGTTDTWEFELRFPTHAKLSNFQEYCTDGHIQLEVGRIYNPTRPGQGPWFGLTNAQRDALSRAVDGGYYSIPRRMSTQELADELGISDQAVTERLRRAIIALAENTLIAAQKSEAFEPVE